MLLFFMLLVIIPDSLVLMLHMYRTLMLWLETLQLPQTGQRWWILHSHILSLG